MSKTTITVARGDGIGPEIMDATLHILGEAGAELEIEEISIGEKLFQEGNTSGISPDSWECLERTKVFLKAPITTPQGDGVKSLNVTVRKALGLFANVRPAISYSPYIKTLHPDMDLVIIRENEEGLYAGVEFQLSDDVMNAYKFVTRQGTERIIRFAFEYAKKNKRKKVTCFTKDNILKVTDGLFHKEFDRIAVDYPEIENEHWIVDIGCAKLANSPEIFDVIVMPNLYGDILSDMTGQISGSVGIAGAANVGLKYAMFEAIHGSAPRRAGQNLANPSALLFGAVMMLAYINQPQVAARVHNAWLKTIEDGHHTYDIYQEGKSKYKLGTKEFAKAVAERIGKTPEFMEPVQYRSWGTFNIKTKPISDGTNIETIGVDVFVRDASRSAPEIAEALNALPKNALTLNAIGNRGTKLWPNGFENALISDIWQCRFRGKAVTDADILKLLEYILQSKMSIQSTEKLIHINNKRAYSLIQGE